MAISKGKSNLLLQDIQNRIPESIILSYYLNVRKVPCLIKSPLRPDNKPSFGLYSRDGRTVHFKDFSTGDSGSLYDLLSQMWGFSFEQVLARINKDISKMTDSTSINASSPQTIIKKVAEYDDTVTLQCKVREWRKHDIDYWKSYGVSLEWLKYAEVYPISHKFITKGDKRYVFPADRYAYAFVEHKEGNVTLKIYQPFNKRGFKWCSKHDHSVIGLWTKVPEYGESICICSSLKDALCLWSNTGIPSMYIQGETYRVSDTARNELVRRFGKVFICLDNDGAGLTNAERLSHETGFQNVILPQFEEGKDLSDYYKAYGKEKFTAVINSIFNPDVETPWESDLPFKVEY